MEWHLYHLAAACLLLYICGLAAYRAFLHPMSKYPGPKLAALSNWYVTFYAWRGDLHLKFQSWHGQYGKTFRYGPNSIIFNDATDMAQIYGIRGNVRKVEGYGAMSGSRRIPNTLTAIDKKVHGFKRRILAQVYSVKGIQEVENRVIGNINDFVKVLGAGNVSDDGWTTQNMAHVISWLTMDVISDLCFGEDFDMLNSPQMRWLPEMITKIVQRGMMCVLQPKVYKYKIDHLLLASLVKDIKAASNWMHDRAEARAKIGNDVKEKDILYAMMNSKDPKTGQGFTAKDLWLESMLLLAAGSDTTTAAMSGLFFNLLHNPDALSRATAEVRSTFTGEAQIRTGPELSSCKFLQACINESLRLTPAVANILPRTVDKGGITIGGEYFPEGTTLGSAIYCVQRNDDYISRPDEFQPDRWIENTETGVTAESIKQLNQAFCPFSVGSRSCVGWRLAWLELNVTVAKTLYLYDIRMDPDAPCCKETPPGEVCEFEMKGWVTSSVDGPMAQFRRI